VYRLVTAKIHCKCRCCSRATWFVYASNQATLQDMQLCIVIYCSMKMAVAWLLLFPIVWEPNQQILSLASAPWRFQCQELCLHLKTDFCCEYEVLGILDSSYTIIFGFIICFFLANWRDLAKNLTAILLMRVLSSHFSSYSCFFPSISKNFFSNMSFLHLLIGFIYFCCIIRLQSCLPSPCLSTSVLLIVTFPPITPQLSIVLISLPYLKRN
jgi:hypothetical protein